MKQSGLVCLTHSYVRAIVAQVEVVEVVPMLVGSRSDALRHASMSIVEGLP
ncbi:hypothetical protein QTH97_30525 [Variovorax sp. J22R24]|uniref:hypothetical protein n=1 Tax=Variovorax gracilis TaxID=3053502 RepID=UPI002574B6B8|nr:hypothetical protein [Variovorax sp. J22R24]MDM0109307.1 hypothetical protein [Variovorax sp. J22R24]